MKQIVRRWCAQPFCQNLAIVRVDGSPVCMSCYPHAWREYWEKVVQPKVSAYAKRGEKLPGDLW